MRIDQPTSTTSSTSSFETPISLFNRLHGLAKEVEIESFELVMGKRLGEIGAVLKGLDLEVGRLLIRERALQLAHRTKISRQVGASLLFVPLNEVVDDMAIGVVTSKERITSRHKDLKDQQWKEGTHRSYSTENVVDDT